MSTQITQTTSFPLGFPVPIATAGGYSGLTATPRRGEECPDGCLMLCRDETALIRGEGAHFQDEVSSSRVLFKTVVQAQSTISFRIGTTTPGDQSVATAPVTRREQMAERQRDSSSHGVGRKHWWCRRPRPTRSWGHTCEFLIGGDSCRFGVGCGRTDCCTIVDLRVTPLYPYVVDPQRFRVLACLNTARRCYFSVLHELCQFSFQHARISRRPFLGLQTFVNSIVD